MPVAYYHALLNSRPLTPAIYSVETFFSGSRIVLPNSAIWGSVPTDWTVEAWVKISSTQVNYHTIIGMGSAGDEFGFFHHRSSSGALGEIRVYQSGSGGDIVQSTNAIVPFGVWAHLAVTRRSSDSTFCTYLNGTIDVLNHAMIAAQTSAIGTARTLCGDGSSEPADGDVSDVRVWNVARSAAQIAANYQRRLTGSESGLLGYWRLDDGPASSGTSAADSTSNAATGTLTSPPNCEFVVGGPSFYP